MQGNKQIFVEHRLSHVKFYQEKLTERGDQMGQNNSRKIFKKCQSGDEEVDSKCLFRNRGHKGGRKRLLKEDQVNAQIRAQRKDRSLALTSDRLKDEATEEAVCHFPGEGISQSGWPQNQMGHGVIQYSLKIMLNDSLTDPLTVVSVKQ